MARDRSILERQIADVEIRSFTLDEFHRRRHRKQRNRRVATTLMAVGLAAAAIGGVAIRAVGSNAHDRTVVAGHGPSALPPSDYVGTWESTDTDGSSQTLVLRESGDGDHAMVLHDDAATGACAGAAATISGTGRLQGDGTLVVAAELTCDDGTTPIPLQGDPETARQFTDGLAHITFTYDRFADQLVDGFRVTWRRAGRDG
ncbi:MAG: hypothetical protein ACJ739_16295 [Acidimicrobiales bacterium]